MTVPLTARRAGPFLGDGVVTNFDFTFLVLSDEDALPLLLHADGVELALTPGVDYTVTPNVDQVADPGGTVAFTLAPATGQTVVVLGDLAFEQPVALPPGGNFRAENVEQGLDRLAILAQQLKEEQDRSLTISAGIDVDASLVLPLPEGGAAIGWNAAGDGMRNYSTATFASVAAFAEQYTEFFTLTVGQTNVTLANNPYALSNIQVWKNNVVQRPGVDFSYTTGTSFQLAVAATGGEALLVRYGRVLENSDLAQTAADRVATGADRVQTGLDRVQTGADREQTALDRAQTGADRAKTGVDRVECDNARIAANNSAALAGISATAADASKELAEKWAEEDEDVEVAPGEFSAKHWAAKALTSAPATAAESVVFDPAPSGIVATDLQAAVDEILGTIYGGRNKIINGSMEIEQRGPSFPAVVSGAYTLDRWSTSFASLGTTYTISQSALAPAEFVNSLRVNPAAAVSVVSATYAQFEQRIEGYSIKDLVGRTFTLSFWVYSPKTGIHSVALQNAASNLSYIAEYTVLAANTWERKKVTVPGGLPASGWSFGSGTGLKVAFCLVIGSSASTASLDTWLAGDKKGSVNQVNVLDGTGNFYLTGVQLELGAAATMFERRPYGTELALCQRYYAKTFSQGVTPAANSGNRTGCVTCVSSSTNANTAQANWVFPVDMRSNPSISTFNPNAAGADWFNVNTGTSVAGSAVDIGTRQASMRITGAPPTADHVHSIHAVAAAEL